MAERYLSGTGRGRASRSIPAALDTVVRGVNPRRRLALVGCVIVVRACSC